MLLVVAGLGTAKVLLAMKQRLLPSATEQIRHLIAAGDSATSIATELGVDRSTVYRVIKKFKAFRTAHPEPVGRVGQPRALTGAEEDVGSPSIGTAHSLTTS